jgi:hypothetical protein
MKTLTLIQDDGAALALELRAAGEQPAVAAEGREFGTLAALAQAYPALCSPGREALCAELCLHFQPEPACRPIVDAEAYRERYRALLQYEAAGEAPALADFGEFDLSEIGPPQVRGERFVFYAEELRFGLPYRVEAPWPAGAAGAVDFLLLSLAE